MVIRLAMQFACDAGARPRFSRLVHATRVASELNQHPSLLLFAVKLVLYIPLYFQKSFVSASGRLIYSSDGIWISSHLPVFHCRFDYRRRGALGNLG